MLDRGATKSPSLEIFINYKISFEDIETVPTLHGNLEACMITMILDCDIKNIVNAFSTDSLKCNS